jgi:hypothetical protein
VDQGSYGGIAWPVCNRRRGGLRTAEAIGAIADFNCSRALASGSRGGTGDCRWAEEISKPVKLNAEG